MDAFWEFVGSWTFILILVALLGFMIVAGPLAIILILIYGMRKQKRSDRNS
jgi:hypothetical protein